MKRLLVLFFTIAVVSLTAEEHIVLAGGEWPPYVSEDLNFYGITPRLISDVLASVGVKVHYRFYPWSRSLEAAKQGVVDGTFLWFKTLEREKDFWFSHQPIGVNTFVFFHLSSHPFKWKTYEDLKGLRIGATISYHYGDRFMAAETKGELHVIRVKSDLQSLHMLLKKRIDIFPHDLTVAYYEISKNFPPEKVQAFAHHSLPLYEKGGYLLLSKKNEKNKKMMKLFDQAFTQFKQQGKYDQYYFDDVVQNVYTK